MSTPELAIPKYIAIAEDFRTQIESGELKPGDRLPSFVEMRVQHGVAPVTVERIYAYLEKDELVIREQGRGTFVKQRQAKTRTGVVALSGAFVSLSQHPYYAHLLEGCHKAAAAAGVKLLLLNDIQSEDWAKQVDGILVCEGRPRIRERILKQMPGDLPCVMAIVKEREFTSVLADDYQGAYDMAQALIEAGHRRIGCIYDPVPSARFTGYCDALREAGIELSDTLIRTGWRQHTPETSYSYSGKTVMQEWLAQGWSRLGCTALMTQNDDTAIGVIHTLSEAGYSVPADVSVTGFDGTEVGRYFMPSLATVEVPLVEVGTTAMNWLLRQIEGEKSSANTIVLPTRYVPGASVGSANAESKTLRRGLLAAG